MAGAKREDVQQQKKLGSAVERIRAHLGGVARLDELRALPLEHLLKGPGCQPASSSGVKSMNVGWLRGGRSVQGAAHA